MSARVLHRNGPSVDHLEFHQPNGRIPPRTDVAYHEDRLQLLGNHFGKFERAVEEGQKTIALDPDVTLVWVSVAIADLMLDKRAEAKAVLQKAAVSLT